MKEVKLYWVDAFSDKPFYGNSAAVIIDADELSDETKQEIARGLNLSETVFVSRSEVADLRVQFFTPKQETALCGHGTIAAFYVLASIGRTKQCAEGVTSVFQETKAGILPIDITFKHQVPDSIMMNQALPEFRDTPIIIEEIARLLNIPVDKLDNNYPLKIVSTGRPKLLIPIINKDVLYDIRPDFDEIKKYCLKQSITGFHLFTFDTHSTDSITAARHFAPSAGVNEDPVTGIAAGALGCYLLEYGNINNSSFQMEQGFGMGRNGIVKVDINKENQLYKTVRVGGKAHILFSAEMRL